MNTHEERRIFLEGAYNVRTLGGFATQEGGLTREETFVRADGTSALTDRDIAEIRARRIALAVDLRSPIETENYPSRLRELDGIRYENVPMFDGIHSNLFEGEMPSSMAEVYRLMLDYGKSNFARLFHLFAAEENPILFHCTAGKDRTGVTAMLLLHLAGVSEQDIVEDYSRSEIYSAKSNMEYIAQQRALGRVIQEHVFRSKPEQMEQTLGYLKKQYGSAKEYLLSVGIDGQELNDIKIKFVKL